MEHTKQVTVEMTLPVLVTLTMRCKDGVAEVTAAELSSTQPAITDRDVLEHDPDGCDHALTAFEEEVQRGE